VGQLLAQRTTQALNRPLVAKRQLDRAHDRQTRLAALTGLVEMVPFPGRMCHANRQVAMTLGTAGAR
jgi:hypothetical protein